MRQSDFRKIINGLALAATVAVVGATTPSVVRAQDTSATGARVTTDVDRDDDNDNWGWLGLLGLAGLLGLRRRDHVDHVDRVDTTTRRP